MKVQIDPVPGHVVIESGFDDAGLLPESAEQFQMHPPQVDSGRAGVQPSLQPVVGVPGGTGPEGKVQMGDSGGGEKGRDRIGAARRPAGARPVIERRPESVPDADGGTGPGALPVAVVKFGFRCDPVAVQPDAAAVVVPASDGHLFG